MVDALKTCVIRTTRRITFAIAGILISHQNSYAKFDGFYVGGSLGYLQQNTSINAQQNPANPYADVYKSTAGRAMPVTELFLGWGKVFANHFYGGLEGQVDYVISGKKTVAEDICFKYQSIRKGPGLSFLFRLGYLITPKIMIYGGFGAKLVNFQSGLFEKAGQIPAQFNSRSLRLLTEVGIELPLFSQKDMVVRISYSYMPTKNIVRKSANFPANHMYHDNGIFKTGVSEQITKLGLIYQF